MVWHSRQAGLRCLAWPPTALARQDVEDWLQLGGLDEEFQVVGFHPQFIFAGADCDDAGHFVNRSPFPALHFLRQEDVTIAVDSHPSSLSVSRANKKLLQTVGVERLKQLVGETLADGHREVSRTRELDRRTD